MQDFPLHKYHACSVISRHLDALQLFLASISSSSSNVSFIDFPRIIPKFATILFLCEVVLISGSFNSSHVSVLEALTNILITVCLCNSWVFSHTVLEVFLTLPLKNCSLAVFHLYLTQVRSMQWTNSLTASEGRTYAKKLFRFLAAFSSVINICLILQKLVKAITSFIGLLFLIYLKVSCCLC